MEKYKYTSDGRKVAVIGKLNSQEYIVQEIFVINDKEIPSGESFVTKSLHDAPAISWKEKRLKEIEDKYNEKKQLYDKELSRLRASYKKAVAALTEKTNYLRRVIDNVSVDSFDMIVNFLSGNIRYLVRDEYHPEIVTYNDFMCDYNHDKLRLITLFGRDDGTLVWGINRYSDGSGYNELYYAFTNKEDAVEKLRNLLMGLEKVDEYIIKTAKEYNIKIPIEKIKDFKNRKINELKKYIEDKKKEIKEYESRIKDLNKIDEC